MSKTSPRAAKIIAICLSAVFLLMLSLAAAVSAFQSRSEDSTWQWVSNNNGHRQEIKIRGDVQFTDDETDVKSISADGCLFIREKNGSTDRQYEVRNAGFGKVERIFTVQGERQSIDQDARRWIAEMILQTIRQTGYNASGRVQRILKQNGSTGVLSEISLISSDTAKRIYFEELIKQGHLDAAMTQRAVQQATREISSDSAKAILLEKWSELYTAGDATVSSFIQGANSISSDTNHAEVLAEILRRPNLTRAQLSEVFRSVRRISSDSQKRTVLAKIADNRLTDDSIVVEYVSTAESISSDSEHRKALLAILNKPRVNNENLSQIMRAVRGISSDGEKAAVLTTVLDSIPGDNSLLVSELLDAAKSISSNGEHGRVVSALLRKPNLSQDAFIQIFRSTDDF